jgi:DNA-binding transcriptional LysR family regulator
MELRHLRYFLGVAEALNFTRAAEKLRVAQPALSRQVSDLEAELGVRLFNRSTKRVQLTEAGRHFQKSVEKVLGQLDVAVTGMQQIARGVPDTLKIGVDFSYFAVPIAAAARDLREGHPRLSVELVELPGYQQLDAVRSGVIDVGFVSGFLGGSKAGIERHLICSCRMMALLPAGHPLAKRRQVRLAELKTASWVVAADFAGYALMLRHLCRQSHFVPKFGPGARSVSGILTLVGAGEGVGLIPEIKLSREPENVAYVETDSPPYELFAAWLRTNFQPGMADYVAILRARLGKAPKTLPRRSR